MAQIPKSGTVSLATVTKVYSLGGLLAGEAIAAGDACYIKSDGKAWLAHGTLANAAAQVFGYACQAASVGEAVTLAWNVRFRYGSGLAPGAKVFLSATPGTLSDIPTTGGVEPVGVIVDATRIHLWQARY